jgi:hypothetical protein
MIISLDNLTWRSLTSVSWYRLKCDSWKPDDSSFGTLALQDRPKTNTSFLAVKVWSCGLCSAIESKQMKAYEISSSYTDYVSATKWRHVLKLPLHCPFPPHSADQAPVLFLSRSLFNTDRVLTASCFLPFLTLFSLLSSSCLYSFLSSCVLHPFFLSSLFMFCFLSYSSSLSLWQWWWPSTVRIPGESPYRNAIYAHAQDFAASCY